MGIRVINESRRQPNSVTGTTDRLSKQHPILKEERSLVVRRKDKPVKRSLVTENLGISLSYLVFRKCVCYAHSV